MQHFQPQVMSIPPRLGHSGQDTSHGPFVHDSGAVMRGVVKRVAALLDRRAHAERAISDKYTCHRWCDSMERQLNNDAFNSRF